MFEKEKIRAFAISCRAKELRRILHDLAIARIITGAILDYDARKIEKALSREQLKLTWGKKNDLPEMQK